MKTTRTFWVGLVSVSSLAAIVVAAINALADPPTPVLSISMGASNLLSVTITNGVTNANYQLFVTESLGQDADWLLFTNGFTGQTNFTISTVDLDLDSAFFMAANNTNGTPFTLTITIEQPTNGSNVQ
jgi:hypothetical protein